jgi:hypothetical protein
MTRRERVTSWLLLGIVAGLFVLCAITPRTWEQVARSQSADELLSQISASYSSSGVRVSAASLVLTLSHLKLAEIPLAVQNPPPAKSQYPVEVPLLQVSLRSSEKLADNGALPGLLLGGPQLAPVATVSGAHLKRLPAVNDVAARCSPKAKPEMLSVAKPAPKTPPGHTLPILPASDRLPPTTAIVASNTPQDVAAAPIRVASIPARAQPQDRATFAFRAPAPSWEELYDEADMLALEYEQPAPGGRQAEQAAADGQVPESLRRHLESLALTRETGPWATEAATLLRNVDLAVARSADEAQPLFGRLQDLTDRADTIADKIEAPGLAPPRRPVETGGPVCRAPPAG